MIGSLAEEEKPLIRTEFEVESRDTSKYLAFSEFSDSGAINNKNVFSLQYGSACLKF